MVSPQSAQAIFIWVAEYPGERSRYTIGSIRWRLIGD